MSINDLFQLPTQGYQSLHIETSGDLWTAILEVYDRRQFVGRGENPDAALQDLKKELAVCPSNCQHKTIGCHD